ncbi:FG-GAP repeat-containing protein, partial [Streptomyces sp. Ncost-T6T-2b]
MTSRALGTGVVLALTFATAVVALPATAQAAPAPAPDPHGPRADFNGDGYPDLAFAAPGRPSRGSRAPVTSVWPTAPGNGVKDSAKRVFT